MPSMKLLALVASTLFAGASARKITVYNACPFTIWPAIFTPTAVNSEIPNHPTGWEAPAWSSVVVDVPETWTSARIWGRRNCDMSKLGPNNCLSGGCLGGLECDRSAGTGVPPASAAEWTFKPGEADYYDVSLVDGFNLPMRISNNQGCPVADCPVDLGPNCPGELRGATDASGFPVGCKSACSANLDGTPTNSANCCSGSYDKPETCPSSGVRHYDYFKSNCPNSYTYAYDEHSGTALWMCPSDRKPEYTLTFCP